MKQKSPNKTNDCQNCLDMVKVCSENQILHNILQSGCIDTLLKRNVIIQKKKSTLSKKKFTLAKIVKKKTAI